MAYKKIMVAISGKGDETPLIDEAVRLSHSFGADLIACHVNDPHAGSMSMMMNSPGRKFTEIEIRDIFRKAGHEEVAEKMPVKILTKDNVSQALAEESEQIDLLILGHRRMNTFRQNFFDSIDEGIVNHVQCPVLIVPKPPRSIS